MVKYNRTVCDEGVIFENFIITPGTDPNCDVVKQTMFNLSGENLRRYIDNIDAVVTRDIEISDLNNLDLDDKEKFPCSPVSSTKFISHVIKNSCYTYCIYNTTGLPGGVINEEVTCGQGCCIRKTPFCYAGNELIKFSPTVESDNAACDLMAQPCYGNSCELDCTRLIVE